MDGADWLRTQLTSFGCAACGQAYEPRGIRVLAERGSLFFVDLTCEHCGTQAVAIVTIEIDEDEGPQAQSDDLVPVRRGTRSTRDERPVTADDVLVMHQLLADFDGDVGRLLRRLDGDPMAQRR